jgi:hypothetical protein
MTNEEREERIRSILKGLVELGCIPVEKANTTSLFSLSLGLEDGNEIRDDVVEDIEPLIVE